ncbi:MAG: VOC family protein [Cyclobacteriaceae bacterium]
MIAGIDHIVYAAPDLALGIKRVEELLGVEAVVGGQHLGRGTHNALLALGDDIYLEIIAPDPAQTSMSSPLWMRVDAIKEPKLIAWAAQSDDLMGLTGLASGNSISLGKISTGSRNLPDGQVLSWQLTEPNDDTIDWLTPFFIDWGQSPHPAASLPSAGTLISLTGSHPQHEKVQDATELLGYKLPTQRGARVSLNAGIQTNSGIVVLQ